MTPAPCKLCGATAILEESHILPAFVFRWMKDTSATGYLRFGGKPNRRVQDGERRSWLCRGCETRLCQWETEFARQVFHPLICDGGRRIPYQEWMLKFAVSVSWRVLSLFVEDDRLRRLNDGQRLAVDVALKRWSDFLLGSEAHPGVHEQHFLAFDAVEFFTASDVPSNINRYLLRAADIDVGVGDTGSFVYSKVAKFMLVGFVDMSFRKQWVGTKISLRKGWVGQGNFTVPKNFGDFIFSKCRHATAVKERISQKQQATIEKSMRKDLDRVAASASFAALNRDVNMFGGTAFGRKDSADEQ